MTTGHLRPRLLCPVMGTPDDASTNTTTRRCRSENVHQFVMSVRGDVSQHVLETELQSDHDGPHTTL